MWNLGTNDLPFLYKEKNQFSSLPYLLKQFLIQLVLVILLLLLLLWPWLRVGPKRNSSDLPVCMVECNYFLFLEISLWKNVPNYDVLQQLLHVVFVFKWRESLQACLIGNMFWIFLIVNDNTRKRSIFGKNLLPLFQLFGFILLFLLSEEKPYLDF